MPGAGIIFSNMTNINIRRAEAGDCARILELVQELATFERAPQEVTVSAEHFRNSGFGEQPVWWAFVAETAGSNKEKGAIVGFALYYIRFSTWKGQTLYLEDILVTEEMRGKNIGTQLFEKVMQDAREKGFSRMAWQVLEWNTPAIRFYKKYHAVFDGEWVNCSINIPQK